MIDHEDVRRSETRRMLAVDGVFVAVLVAMVLYFRGCEASAVDNGEQWYRIDSHVSAFLANHPKRLEFARSLYPHIIAESEEYMIDPIIPAVLIGLESSWRKDANGTIGEVGLMQVIPSGVCARGYDLTTAQGQISAGIACLSKARDFCGDDLRRMLTAYASGRCVARTVRTARMVDHRVKLIEGAR